MTDVNDLSPVDRACMCGGFKRAQLLERVVREVRALYAQTREVSTLDALSFKDLDAALEALDTLTAPVGIQ